MVAKLSLIREQLIKIPKLFLLATSQIYFYNSMILLGIIVDYVSLKINIKLQSRW